MSPTASTSSSACSTSVTGGIEVALVLVGARAPLEDLGAQPVAGAAGALAELEGERQVVDGAGVGAPLDAHAADPEEHLRAVEIVEAGPVRDLLGGLEQAQRLVELAAVHLRPRARGQAAQREVGILGGDDGDLVQQATASSQRDSSTACSAATTCASSAPSSSSRNTSVTGGSRMGRWGPTG